MAVFGAVSTVRSAMTLTTDTAPAPAVKARPRVGFEAASTTATIAGRSTTQTAPVAIPNGDPSKVWTTPIRVATPTMAAPSRSSAADPRADRPPERPVATAGGTVGAVIPRSPRCQVRIDGGRAQHAGVLG